MTKSSRYRFLVAVITLLVLSLACSSHVTIYETPVPPNIQTIIAATFAAFTAQAPQVTLAAIPTVTSLPVSPTPEEFGDVYIYTTVDNVNLRAQPGMLFQVSRVLPKDSKLKLLGRAPGGDWLNVSTEDDISGWVNVNVVRVAYDGPPVPVIEPTDVLLVTGTVVTELGTPVSGVGYAVVQGSRRTDAKTDETGQFYAYLPRTMSGTWAVEYNSIACTSNTMDSKCNCIGGKCGSSTPVALIITLPQTEPLQFIWK